MITHPSSSAASQFASALPAPEHRKVAWAVFPVCDKSFAE